MQLSCLRVILALFVAFLALTGGAAAQAMDPKTQAIVTNCGVATAIKLKTLAPKCSNAAAKAKACPASCKTVGSLLKNPKCAAALNAVTPPSVTAKVNKVRKTAIPACNYILPPCFRAQSFSHTSPLRPLNSCSSVPPRPAARWFNHLSYPMQYFV